jgi:predicted transcriptional regulator
LSSKKRIKIELEDSQGDKYNLSLEGNFSKEKILYIMELVDLVQSGEKPHGNKNNASIDKELVSIDSKIWHIIDQSFHKTSFTSSDIVEFYEEKYKESIKLSVISTYLSRYCTKGKLLRTKKLREYVYSLPLPSTKDLSSNYQNNLYVRNNNKNLYHIENKNINDLIN